jgi:hypothetical protein
MEDLHKYWQAVQLRVCAHCIDSDGHGNCRLTSEDACGLKFHFPKILETVFAVQGNTIEPYIEALRQNVCAECKHQSADGTCTFRSNHDCGLDRYFPLVIEVIETTRLQTENTIGAYGD